MTGPQNTAVPQCPSLLDDIAIQCHHGAGHPGHHENTTVGQTWPQRRAYVMCASPATVRGRNVRCQRAQGHDGDHEVDAHYVSQGVDVWPNTATPAPAIEFADLFTEPLPDRAPRCDFKAAAGQPGCALPSGHAGHHLAPASAFERPSPICDAVAPHSGTPCVRPAGHFPDSPHYGYVGTEGTPTEWGRTEARRAGWEHPSSIYPAGRWCVVVTNVGTQDRDYYGILPERPARALATSVRTELERLGRNPASFHVAAALLQPATLRAIVDDQWGRS